MPNFSEGRDEITIESIAAAVSGVEGTRVLDVSSDASHNRSVVTFVAEPAIAVEAAVRAVGWSAEMIDITRHSGAHPRIGAADVVPFVPLSGVTMEECVALAHHAGREIWSRYGIPVYFYEAAALRPDRVDLAHIRKGGYEVLRSEALSNPDRAPDVGGPALHPRAGACAVGARWFLVAYNVDLEDGDVDKARAIAAAIRESSGGLPKLKAIGLKLDDPPRAQVSMNLTDYRVTGLRAAWDAVNREAAKTGARVGESELIGLAPRAALDAETARAIRLRGFHKGMILENKLADR